MIPALALHALPDGRLVLIAGDWTATYPALRSATVEKERPAPVPAIEDEAVAS